MRPRPALLRPRLLYAVLLLAALWPVRASGAPNTNPGVLPPGGSPYGKTYGEWGAAWWSWALSIPADRNPILDVDGSFCAEGQSGPVWFLAGTGGAPVSRTCSVPAGKAVLFPIINVLVDYPCPPEFGFEPAPGQTLEEFLGEFAAFLMDLVDQMAVEVDGVPLGDLASYRANSRMFTFTGDPSMADAFDPCVTGTPQPGVSDGYWVMLAPLSPGGHTVHFSAAASALGFSLDVTYLLQVGPRTGAPIPILSAGRAGGATSQSGPTSLKAAAQAAGILPGATGRRGSWGELKVLYR